MSIAYIQQYSGIIIIQSATGIFISSECAGYCIIYISAASAVHRFCLDLNIETTYILYTTDDRWIVLHACCNSVNLDESRGQIWWRFTIDVYPISSALYDLHVFFSSFHIYKGWIQLLQDEQRSAYSIFSILACTVGRYASHQHHNAWWCRMLRAAMMMDGLIVVILQSTINNQLQICNQPSVYCLILICWWSTMTNRNKK